MAAMILEAAAVERRPKKAARKATDPVMRMA